MTLCSTVGENTDILSGTTEAFPLVSERDSEDDAVSDVFGTSAAEDVSGEIIGWQKWGLNETLESGPSEGTLVGPSVDFEEGLEDGFTEEAGGGDGLEDELTPSPFAFVDVWALGLDFKGAHTLLALLLEALEE